MNEKQIHKFLLGYLEATNSKILEKSPAHLTVKLSPEADRELTNRPYYWSYVDSSGTDPETMTMLFVTDKKHYDSLTTDSGSTGAAAPTTSAAPATSLAPTTPIVPATPIMPTEPTASTSPAAPADTPGSSMESNADAVLGRSLGFLHGSLNTNTVRIPREDLYFGSRKLDLIFTAAKTGGSFVYLFQEPERRPMHPLDSYPYTAWLGVNIKVEFASDRKREEIHSLAVSLATGQLMERFHDRLGSFKLTPKLPPNIHLTKNGITLHKAFSIIEQLLVKKLKQYDYEWAVSASGRLDDELAQVDHYYELLLESVDEDNRSFIEEQYKNRQSEIRWQFEPRISAQVINGGIFHLSGIS